MKERKYKLTDDTIMVDGHILHRIEAVRDFSDVKSGDKGGYLESEDNLSHEGNCWVYDDSKVYNNSRICGHVQILGLSVVSGNGCLSGNDIYDSCVVRDYNKDSKSSVIRVKSKDLNCSVINNNDALDNCVVIGLADGFDTEEFVRKFNSPFLRTLKH